jgi:hypothetical protein
MPRLANLGPALVFLTSLAACHGPPQNQPPKLHCFAKNNECDDPECSPGDGGGYTTWDQVVSRYADVAKMQDAGCSTPKFYSPVGGPEQAVSTCPSQFVKTASPVSFGRLWDHCSGGPPPAGSTGVTWQVCAPGHECPHPAGCQIPGCGAVPQ